MANLVGLLPWPTIMPGFSEKAIFFRVNHLIFMDIWHLGYIFDQRDRIFQHLHEKIGDHIPLFTASDHRPRVEEHQ